jgi:hypothetical protein
MHSFRGGFNHWSMDFDAALLPLLCQSHCEDIYTINLMPYFSWHTHCKLTTYMQHEHFTHTSNMYAAHKPHTHCMHALSMPYDGHTHTTSTMNIRVHAPQRRGCEHACMHVVWMRGCSMHACNVRHACLYGVQASSIYSCWEGEVIVLVPYLLQICSTI